MAQNVDSNLNFQEIYYCSNSSVWIITFYSTAYLFFKASASAASLVFCLSSSSACSSALSKSCNYIRRLTSIINWHMHTIIYWMFFAFGTRSEAVMGNLWLFMFQLCNSIKTNYTKFWNRMSVHKSYQEKFTLICNGP